MSATRLKLGQLLYSSTSTTEASKASFSSKASSKVSCSAVVTSEAKYSTLDTFKVSNLKEVAVEAGFIRVEASMASYSTVVTSGAS